jgi:hypothetical protein
MIPIRQPRSSATRHGPTHALPAGLLLIALATAGLAAMPQGWPLAHAQIGVTKPQANRSLGQQTQRLSESIDLSDDDADGTVVNDDHQDEDVEDEQPELPMLREGTPLKLAAVQCKTIGERLQVTLESDGRQLLALENLNCQRLWQAVRDNRNDDRWIISGTITEFQGRNFVLLERSTRQQR